MKIAFTRFGIILLWLMTLNYYALSIWYDFNFNIFLFVFLIIIFIISIIKFPSQKTFTKTIIKLDKGNKLLSMFLISVSIEVLITFLFLQNQVLIKWKPIITHFSIAIILESIVFWTGITKIYLSSIQLGIKWRVIGALCGWIPIVHIFTLCKIIVITQNEVKFEKEKYLVNITRAEDTICKTKYPIILVHGVFFRDSSLFNYWGRIPKHLKKNGAEIYYGEHQSAASIEESGLELADKIKEIVNQTGCEKVNIIAHSKGGLDCRYLISCTDAGKYIASLTTVNTPHRGCLFSDYLLEKISPKVQNSVAKKYNIAAKKLGDKNPDFLKAVNSLTSKSCQEFNNKTVDLDTVYYQSVGSKMTKAGSGKFPLNMVYHLVKHFDGENDSLVSVDSMKWGNKFKLVTTTGKRGISHGDIIDLNRENITGFDVREFYAELVHNLKLQGF